MTSFIQLITFCVSFIYGILFYYFSICNFILIDKFNKYLKYIITIVYVLDMTVIYVIILYKLNNGYFHIYFILMVFIGYYVGYLTKLLLLSKTNVKNLINKLKK